MRPQRVLKLVHFVSTTWFMLCIGFISVLALRQAGQSWWVIVSLSGYSTLIIFLLISLYLFAIYRGVARTQKIEVEHPLTSAAYYKYFYAAAPFLGGSAGMLAMIGEIRISQFLLGVALGTFGTTFLVWIIVDPVLGLCEMLLPGSRRHRQKRLAELRTFRAEREDEHRRLLAEVTAREEINRRRWQLALEPYAEELALLLASGRTASKQAADKAAQIGLRAWQIGGLSCMRQLHEMAIDLGGKEPHDSLMIDRISIWWDGIGSWRNPSLG